MKRPVAASLACALVLTILAVPTAAPVSACSGPRAPVDSFTAAVPSADTSVIGTAAQISPGTSMPDSISETTAAVTANANWIIAATPMPSTLPASNWPGPARASSTSTTAVDFSSTTPVST